MRPGRNQYPFRLGTTSFIYPASYVTNVEKLGPLLDEIELLLFESDPDSWPSRDEISRLIELAKIHNLAYNIHLPLDVTLGDPVRAVRENGVVRLVRIIEHIARLSATTLTLHLEYTSDVRTSEAVSAWQDLTTSSLSDLLTRTLLPGRLFSVETLNYPPAWFTPIIHALDLSVCLDVGHMLLHGFPLARTVTDFHDRITILHLHGVEAGRDHRSVAHLPPPARTTLIPFLQAFEGSVCLELFSLDLLEDSIAAFKEMMAVTDDKCKEQKDAGV